MIPSLSPYQPVGRTASKPVRRMAGLQQQPVRFAGKKSPYFANESRFQWALKGRKQGVSYGRMAKSIAKFPVAFTYSLVMLPFKPDFREAFKKKPWNYLMQSNQRLDQFALKPLFRYDQRYQEWIGVKRTQALEEGNVDGAFKAVHKAIALNPENWEGYYVLGRMAKDLLRIQKGQYTEKEQPSAALIASLKENKAPLDEVAIDAFVKAIELTPNDVRSPLMGLAEVYQVKGENFKAVECLSKLVHEHGDWGISEDLLAEAYVHMGQVDRAIAMVTDRIKDEPGHWPHYRDLTLLYQKRGSANPAEEALADVCQKHPKLVYPLEKLGEVYEKKGQWQKAIQTFQKAYELEAAKDSGDKWRLKTLQTRIEDLNKKANTIQ